MKLPEDAVTLQDVRYLFDALINSYPEMTSYLSEDAPIIENPSIEKSMDILTNYLIYKRLIWIGCRKRPKLKSWKAFHLQTKFCLRKRQNLKFMTI